ncbi:MAG TPA: helix-turn-helix transcriptional regulator [Oculatellaceae cyanobacterium]
MGKRKLYEEELAEALVEVVKEMRDLLGWSQNDLALKTGFHRSYIGDFERGMRQISIKNVSRLAHGLGISASKLMAKAEKRIDKIHWRR